MWFGILMLPLGSKLANLNIRLRKDPKVFDVRLQAVKEKFKPFPIQGQ